MNRLWARLSLMYLVTTTLVLSISGLLVFQRLGPPAELPPTLTEVEVEAVNILRESGVFGDIIQNIFSAQLLSFLLIVIVTGIATSVWASWRMTRPLTTVEEALHLAGQRSTRERVAVTGERELIVLAEAFNGMVAELESAETRRQNLLADVSHELRTPLTVLQSNLRAALDNVHQVDLIQIAKLYDQTRQLNHLVNDLHDLAQAEAKRLTLNKAAVDLVRLVERAGTLFAPLAEERNIQFIVECPDVPVSMQADRVRLTQVLQNLISNALNHTHSEIRLTLTQHDDTIQIAVSDDGVGIGSEHLPHIFDRFYRADSSRSRETGGTGLGLAIVKSIVEAHGGTISAESLQQPSIQQGTRFEIIFYRTDRNSKQ
ncbi:MAG: sensor histidine kinase [Candidatus Promineifilaceae bacterium]